MNNAGSYYSGQASPFQLHLPDDFISSWLDEQDINELWVATTINKGNKQTILGDVQNVFKLFNYLDLVSPTDKIAGTGKKQQ
jgi:hypothetical protein